MKIRIFGDNNSFMDMEVGSFFPDSSGSGCLILCDEKTSPLAMFPAGEWRGVVRADDEGHPEGVLGTGRWTQGLQIEMGVEAEGEAQ